MRTTSFNYAIVRNNYDDAKRETTLLPSPHKKTKYVLIEKQCFTDGSEAINRIIYSNNLNKLTELAKGYVSYYNYPMGVCMDLQGNINEL